MPRPRPNGNGNITVWFVGAAYMPPVAAIPDITNYRVNRTGEQCSPLQPNGQIHANRTISRRGGVTPPYIAIKIIAR